MVVISMAVVIKKEMESFEQFVRRFRRESDKEGRAAKARRRANGFEKPSEQRKREKAAAVKRHHKKLGRESKQMREFHDNR
jgi:small subunit ribosomal protein S21